MKRKRPQNKAGRLPPWTCTRFETQLRLMKLDPELATAFPLFDPVRRKPLPAHEIEYRHTQFWNWVYGSVQRIGKDFNRDSPADLARRKAQFDKRKAVARKDGFPEPSETPALWPPSKYAANCRRISQKLEKLTPEVEPYVPALAETLRNASGYFADEAAETAKLWQGRKRHSQHLETRRILHLMNLVHQETGRWHDPEISELLTLAGLPQYTRETLRVLRSRMRKVTNQPKN